MQGVNFRPALEGQFSSGLDSKTGRRRVDCWLSSKLASERAIKRGAGDDSFRQGAAVARCASAARPTRARVDAAFETLAPQRRSGPTSDVLLRCSVSSTGAVARPRRCRPSRVRLAGGSRVADAAEADVAHAGVDQLWASRGRAVAKAVVAVGAEERTALDDVARDLNCGWAGSRLLRRWASACLRRGATRGRGARDCSPARSQPQTPIELTPARSQSGTTPSVHESRRTSG
jgi:hypothetical protein